MFTMELFTRILKLYPNVTVKRIGEGAKIESIQIVEPSDDLLLEYRSVSDLNTILTESMKTVDSDSGALAESILRCYSTLDSQLQQIKALISGATGWSSRLSQQLTHLYTRNKPQSEKSESFFAGCMLSHPIFFLIAPLYQATTESEWKQASSNVIHAINRLADLYKLDYDFLRQIVSAPVLPQWDQAWLRRKLSSLEAPY